MILGKRTPPTRGGGGWLLVPMAGMALVAPVACGSDDEGAEPSAFASFEPAATDPSFSEPRDAVPLDNGGIAFIARVNGGNALPEDAPESGELTPATVNDRYGVFVIDAPK